MPILLYASFVFVVCRCLTTEEILDEPREWLQSYFKDERNPYHLRKLAYMPTCPFCCSFWISLATMLTASFRLLHNDWRGVLVATAAVMFVANLYMELFSFLRLDNRTARAKAELVETKRDRA